MLSNPSNTYTLDDFAQIPSLVTQYADDPHEERDAIKLADLDASMLQVISSDTQDLIEFGDTKARHPSRSESVCRVCCELGRAGIPKSIAVALLLHPANVISVSVREKSNPRAEAIRQVDAGYDKVTTGWPNTDHKGRPTASYANTMVAINRLDIRGFYDTFRDKEYLTIEGRTEEYSDRLARRVRTAIVQRFKFDPGADHTLTSLNTLCDSNECHSIIEGLNELRWDGIPRVRGLLRWYFGAEDTELNEEISEIFCTAMIRRVKQPGVKFDTIMVLEGKQGSGKSSGLTILAGALNFSDQDLLLMNTQQQAEAIRGVWIFEISELQGLSRADVDKVKAFASRNVDMIRPAYGHKRIDIPRQTVFSGTTNESTYLRDTTGNRRFWPVKTGDKIETDRLREDRYQILAEAVQIEASGRSLILKEELWAEAEQAQKKRMVTDSWADELTEPGIGCYLYEGTLRVSSQDVLAYLGRTPDKQAAGDARRAAEAMRTLGWNGPKMLKINTGKPVRGYEAEPDSGVPHTLLNVDDEHKQRPAYLRVVDGEFTVDGEKVK